MAKAPRRGLMAMEAIDGVTDLGYSVNKLGQIAPLVPMENAAYVQPLYPEHFDPGVKPGMKLFANGTDNEGTDFFAVPIMEDEELDVAENLDGIAALESQLQDLLYLENDLLQAGGMNKHFAMEAQKVIPNFGGVPMGYYTEATTATRYKVSLEELSRGVWAAIAAGVAVVIAAIGKFIFWMMGRRNKGDSTPSSGEVTNADVKAAVQSAKEMPAEVKAMAKSMDVGQKAVVKAEGMLSNNPLTLKNEHGKEYTVHSFQDIINNVFTDQERYGRAKQFFDNRDAYTHDIINGGEFSKKMAALSQSMGAVSSALSIKAETVEGVIRRDLGSHSVSDEMKNNSTLTTVGKVIEVTLMGRTMTLRELADHLSDERKELREKTITNPIMFDKLFSTMHKTYESHTIDTIMREAGSLIECLDAVRTRLEKMKGASRNLSTDGVPGALTQDVGEKIRQTLSSLQEEVIALSMIAAEITLFFRTLETLANHALGFGVEVVRKCSQLMKAQKQDIPDGWKEVLEELNEQHKAITAGYFSLKR